MKAVISVDKDNKYETKNISMTMITMMMFMMIVISMIMILMILLNVVTVIILSYKGTKYYKQ